MESFYWNIDNIEIVRQEYFIDNINVWYFEYSYIEEDYIYIYYISTYSKYRWEWYWEKLINYINNFIKDKWKIWLLQNSLNSDYFYLKNKWKNTNNSIILSYNDSLEEQTKNIINKIICYEI